MSSVQQVLKIALYFLLFFHCKSIIISPTAVEPGKEYYVYSESATSFAQQTILCSSSTSCNIECDAELGCYKTTINASLTTTLILQCTKIDSCKDINLIHGPSDLAEIHCVNDTTCMYGKFNTINTKNVVIECNAIKCTSGCSSPVGACWNATLNAEYANDVTIQCGGDYYDCYYVKLNVNHTSSVLCI